MNAEKFSEKMAPDQLFSNVLVDAIGDALKNRFTMRWKI
jgi:hypothetical protein